MNRSLFLRMPDWTFTPKTAGDEFRNTKSRIVSLQIVGSSASFFLSISRSFSVLYFSRSSMSL